MEQLRRSPRLAMLADDLNRLLAAEQIARQKFQESMNEDSHSEFINGEVVVHSPAKARHHSTRDRIYDLMKTYVRKHKAGVVSTENWLISLTRNDYEPDVVFWSSEKSNLFLADQLRFPAPDLIAEILSPSTEANDRGIKFEDYAAHGVTEYWIVDPMSEFIERNLLTDGQYQLAAKTGDGTLFPKAIVGLASPARAAFDDMINEQAIAAIGAT